MAETTDEKKKTPNKKSEEPPAPSPGSAPGPQPAAAKPPLPKKATDSGPARRSPRKRSIGVKDVQTDAIVQEIRAGFDRLARHDIADTAAPPPVIPPAEQVRIEPRRNGISVGWILSILVLVLLCLTGIILFVVYYGNRLGSTNTNISRTEQAVAPSLSVKQFQPPIVLKQTWSSNQQTEHQEVRPHTETQSEQTIPGQNQQSETVVQEDTPGQAPVGNTVVLEDEVPAPDNGAVDEAYIQPTQLVQQGVIVAVPGCPDSYWYTYGLGLSVMLRWSDSRWYYDCGGGYREWHGFTGQRINHDWIERLNANNNRSVMSAVATVRQSSQTMLRQSNQTTRQSNQTVRAANQATGNNRSSPITRSGNGASGDRNARSRFNGNGGQTDHRGTTWNQRGNGNDGNNRQPVRQPVRQQPLYPIQHWLNQGSNNRQPIYPIQHWLNQGGNSYRGGGNNAPPTSAGGGRSSPPTSGGGGRSSPPASGGGSRGHR